MGNKNKFLEIWASSTDLGRLFGMSAIAANKALTSAGLRDAESKVPTEQAIAEEWAWATPLRDETAHCMWNKRKVRNLRATRARSYRRRK